MFLSLVLLPLGGAPGLSQAADPLRAGEQAAAAEAAELREQRVSKRIVSSDSLPRLLTDLGVSRTDRTRWLQAVARQFGVARVLRNGDVIHFYFVGRWNTWSPGRLMALRIERAGSKSLTWQLRGTRIVYQRDTGVPSMISAGERAAPPAEAAPPPAPVSGEVVKVPAAPPAEAPAKAPPAAAAPTPPTPPATTVTRASPEAAAQAAAPVPDTVKRVTHVIRKGENLGRILRARGVARGAVARWTQAVSQQYSLRQLYPGRKVVLYFAASRGGGATLRALQVESRGGTLLTWQWTDGRIAYRGRNHRVVESELAPKTASAGAPAVAAAPSGDAGPSASVGSSEPLKKVVHTIGKGQILVRILRPLGVFGKEGETWFRAIDKQYPVNSLKPGQRLHLYFAKTPARDLQNNLRAVELEVKKGRKLTWERVGDKVRYGKGRVLTPGRTSRSAAPIQSNGASSAPRKGSYLSEYALARIKQRNGLLEYTPPPNRTTNGNRPPLSLASAERVTHRLKSGEHLWGVLRKYELDNRERNRWLEALKRQKQVNRLQAGSDINFYFKAHENGNGANGSNGATGANGAGRIQAVEIALRSDLRLTWYRSKDGIQFYKDEIPYQQEVRSVSGVITEGSLYGNAKRAGVAVAVVSRMVDILAWDINFQRDLRPGDTYRVLYRRKFRPDSARADQIHILAAEVVNQGRTHTAVYFEGEDGKGHYYDVAGRSVSRSFLRYPVEFRRISSRFSKRRFHPVLKSHRPHYGVDFAARSGTPIRAVGDGRITYAGWRGGYGRLVEVSHGRAMKTRYAHLRRYGPGIRRGTSVKKGQTIGYVGCSGLCTGPHLHYEMWQGNRYVDPLKAKIPVERKLDPLLMKIFEGTRNLFFERLNAGGRTVALPVSKPS